MFTVPRDGRDRGAAAVEMALVLPVLLLVIGGLIDFGRLFYTQLVLSNAAREGARMVALGYNVADVTTRIDQASGGVAWKFVVNPPPPCSATPAPTDYGEVQLTTQTVFKWTMLDVVPSLFGSSIPAPTVQAKGSMRCTG